MFRTLGRPLARSAVTMDDLREEFLAHSGAQPERHDPEAVRGLRPTVRRLVPWWAWGVKSPLSHAPSSRRC